MAIIEFPWLLDILRCPETQQSLRIDEGAFVRPDGLRYPIVDGIPSLVYPPVPGKEEARWQSFYDWFAPFYDFSERILGRLFSGVDIASERRRIISLLGLTEGMRLLEVSPGPGVYQPFLRAAIGARAEYASLDLSFGMLRQCQKRYNNLNIALIQGNGAYLPFADESFDALFHS